MKRIFCLALTAILVMSLFSCHRKKTPKVIQLAEANFEVTVQSEEFDDSYNSVVLKYPVLSGYASDCSEMNEMLRDYALAMYKKEGLASDAEDFYNYKITDVVLTLETADFLSYVVLGQYVGSSSTHMEYVSYSGNLVLSEQKMYSSADILQNFEALKKEFFKGDFLFDFGDEKNVSEMGTEDLLLPYRSEYEIYPYVYFREGYFCLLIEVSHVLGGYAGYRYYMQNVSQYVKPGTVREIVTADISGK